jgi:hypothetical protein
VRYDYLADQILGCLLGQCDVDETRFRIFTGGQQLVGILMESAKLDGVMNNCAVTKVGGGRFHGQWRGATEMPIDLSSKTRGLFTTEIWKFVKSRYIAQKTSSERTFALYEMFPALREAIIQWNSRFGRANPCRRRHRQG